MYRNYEVKLLKATNVNLYEYEREKWTFHAKGCWFYEGQKDPSLTVIGSSNFSARSNRRDTECQFYIYSECPEFRKKLRTEVDYLFSWGKKKTLKDLKTDKTVKLGGFAKVLSRLMKTYL